LTYIHREENEYMEETEIVEREITIEDLAHRMDMFGEQMNWLCENLQSLFMFVNQVGANGGGIRGLLKAAKEAPELKETNSD
jgi:predicted enzyme related to lactoylglutathione lyase